jgi:hypothetical protein
LCVINVDYYSMKLIELINSLNDDKVTSTLMEEVHYRKRYINNYSLRSEISVGDFVLTQHKVCTKSPTLISD